MYTRIRIDWDSFTKTTSWEKELIKAFLTAYQQLTHTHHAASRKRNSLSKIAGVPSTTFRLTMKCPKFPRWTPLLVVGVVLLRGRHSPTVRQVVGVLPGISALLGLFQVRHPPDHPCLIDWRVKVPSLRWGSIRRAIPMIVKRINNFRQNIIWGISREILGSCHITYTRMILKDT